MGWLFYSNNNFKDIYELGFGRKKTSSVVGSPLVGGTVIVAFIIIVYFAQKNEIKKMFKSVTRTVIFTK